MLLQLPILLVRALSLTGQSGSVDFFGVSGLTYVADFARWWASQQAPNHPATAAFLEAERGFSHVAMAIS